MSCNASWLFNRPIRASAISALFVTMPPSRAYALRLRENRPIGSPSKASSPSDTTTAPVARPAMSSIAASAVRRYSRSPVPSGRGRFFGSLRMTSLFSYLKLSIADSDAHLVTRLGNAGYNVAILFARHDGIPTP